MREARHHRLSPSHVVPRSWGLLREGEVVSLEGAHEESGEREGHPQTSPEAVSGVK